MISEGLDDISYVLTGILIYYASLVAKACEKEKS